jgi:hypothetical protein
VVEQVAVGHLGGNQEPAGDHRKPPAKKTKPGSKHAVNPRRAGFNTAAIPDTDVQESYQEDEEPMDEGRDSSHPNASINESELQDGVTMDNDRKTAAKKKRAKVNNVVNLGRAGLNTIAVPFAVSHETDRKTGEVTATEGNSGLHYSMDNEVSNFAFEGSRKTASTLGQVDGLTAEDPICIGMTVWEILPDCEVETTADGKCELGTCDRLANSRSGNPHCNHVFCEECATDNAIVLTNTNDLTANYGLQRAGRCPLCRKYGTWTNQLGVILSPMVTERDVAIGHFYHKETPYTYKFRLAVTSRMPGLWNGLCLLFGMRDIESDGSMRTACRIVMDPDDVQKWINTQQSAHSK